MHNIVSPMENEVERKDTFLCTFMVWGGEIMDGRLDGSQGIALAELSSDERLMDEKGTSKDVPERASRKIDGNTRVRCKDE